MMLSSMVSPTDDDLPWQFQFEDPPFLKENENDSLDSAAQSPSSSLFDDFDDSSSSSLSSPSFTSFSDSGTSSLSSFDMMMSMFPDPTNPTVSEETRMPPPPAPVRKNVVVRRRPRECSMVCWLFRTLLTSEYRALPMNAIFEIFEET
uniref:Fork-head domain-containing protein n=1 Tax=Caenorhabditis japonica TaxID=281687 RepID=A0A8R1EVN5_CAEJA